MLFSIGEVKAVKKKKISYYTHTTMIKKILLLIYGLCSLFWLQAQSPGGVSANLAAWYKADAGVTTGATMTWADQGPNGVNLTQGTAANQPVYNTASNLINFNRCLTFDGTNDRLSNATGGAATANSAFTVYYVAVNNASTTTRYAIGLGASTGANGFYSGTTSAVTTKSSGSNTLVTETSAWQSGFPGITRAGFNGGASAPFYQASNGGAEATSVNLGLNITNTNLSIGARPDGTANFWQGNIAEAIYYTGKHAAANYNRVESYLALKYGITKAGNYINSASATVWTSGAGYDNNIAGIARDDMGGAANSGLNQKQSQSQNSGNQVILGIGDIVTTSNAAHTGSFASTAQYLVWGDNNTAGATTFSSAPYTNRLQRVWKVQNTGSVNQDIRVLIPVALLAQSQSGALLYSTSSTFASGNQLYMNKGIGSVGGTSYYVFTIPAAQANQATFYFTVAYYQQFPGGVSGANLWLRANAGTNTTTDAAALSTWADQSGQRTNLATTSSGVQTFKNNAADNINFNPAVYFDGLGGLNFGNDYIFTPAGNGGVTLFAAAVPDNTAATKSGQFLFDFGTHATRNYALIYSNASSKIISASDFGGFFTSTTISNGLVPTIIGGQINFGSDQYLFNNGLQYSTTAITLPALTTTQIEEAATHGGAGAGDGGPVSIGRQSKSSSFTSEGTRAYQGHLGEIIHFSSNLTAIQRQQVNAYLAIKYGVTLTRDNDNDSTPGETISGSIVEGDYVASDGTTRIWNSDAAYQNNIAGVGRDDTSGLLQRQSQSVNSGHQLAFSLGAIQATNDINISNFFFDKVFFMWGDDAGSLDATTATGNVSYAYRFARIWKTQNTNNLNQAVNVYFPVAAFKNAPASSVYLLYGTTAAALSNGTASAILQSGTTSINGVSNYVFSVSAAALANMQFFSFAANITYPGGVASGLNLWMKGDAGFSASQWLDQSGSGYIFQQNTVANQPAATGTMNFNTAIRFDGVDDFMDITSVAGLMNGSIDSDRTVSMALRSSAATNSAIADFDGTCGGNGDLVLFWQGTVRPDLSPCGTGQANYVSTLASANINIINSHTFANATGAVFIYRNYLQANAVTSAAVASGLTTGTLGRTGAAVSYDGSLGEFIIHNRVLNNTERQQVDSYLAMRYANTLGTTASPVSYLASDGTTTIWTGSATYQNNVSGIGRDDLSGLYQKQSQSTNTGSQVVMALGTVAASNQANANTIATDKQFLIWGDDNGSLTTRVTTGNNTYSYRFTRVWKTQNTGSFAQNMTVYYPVSAFGNALPATVALLYGTSAASLSNGTASAIAQSGTTTINGTSYYVFTVPSAQVANIQFFSFAGPQTAPGGVLSGLNLWVKADAGTSTTTDNTGLTTWNDQSGNAMNGTGIGSPLYRAGSNLLSPNFNPTVSLNGTSQGFSLPSGFSDFTAGTTGFVHLNSNFGTVDSYGRIFHLGTNNGAANSNFNLVGFYRILTSNTLSSAIFNGIDNANAQGSVSAANVLNPANGYTIMGFDIGAGTSGQTGRSGSIFSNGLTVATTNAHVTPYTGTRSFNYIGTSPINEYMNGLMSEVILYNSQLTTVEKLRVSSYLAIKYGNTLSNDNNNNATSLEVISGAIKEGDYVASDGTTIPWTGSNTYQNNIAGIGRDDLSALYQKQSQSMNSGSQVVMALGTVAASNQANANTIATDKQFFIWGNDAGSLDATTATGNVSYAYRFARIWKTQNTNNLNQAVNVYFPVAAFKNAPASSVYLLYGTTAAALSNGTASAILQSGTTSINGVSNYVFSVSAAALTNMQFFSFAANITYPGGVTGEALWLRADVGTSTTTNGAALSQWNDQSLNANNVTQATAANQPTYRNNTTDNVNFNPVIRFDGTNDRLNGAADILPDNSQQLSFSGVYRSSATTGNILASSNITNGPDDGLIISTGVADAVINRTSSLFVLAGDGSINTNNSISSGSSSFPINTLTLSSFVKTGATTGAIFSRGLALATTGSINNPMSFSNQTTQLVIGSGTDPDATYSPFFSGVMGDVIVYGSNLTAAQRLRVESYLAIKYGLTLGNTSTILNYTASDGTTILWTGNTTYQNNIAGIGRDDLSGLYQKQSQSVNSGSQVVMALGTAAASNQANANTIPTDKQFLIWGDDNGSLTTQVTTGNNTYTYRFTRVWRAQNTGSFAENITVYYPVSAFGNALPATVALLYGTSAASLSNGTASAIAQSGTTTINGTSYYAFTVPSAQVANMQFFSFAGPITAPGGVTGENLWLKADTGTSTTTDGVAMSQWNDQSGNANNVLQGTAANMPLYRSNNANLMNFNPTVSFDGTNDFMDATTFNINGAANTLFSAVKPNVVNVTQDILGFGAGGSNNGGEFRFNNATLQYGQNNNAIFVAITSGSVLTAGTPLLFGSSMENVTNGVNLYQNNRTLTTGTIGLIPSAANLVSIGSRTINSRNFYFNGFIPEVITYNSLLTATQRQRVNTYLSIKYGITMDQTVATDYLASDGTTILWNGTSNAAYNKNIAGIGRDDLSALNQKQSQSVNSGSQVVMALGAVSTNNLTNANTFSFDKQFLIWGDDNGSITSIVSTGNGTYSYRLTRIWKAQNTGSFAENITVYYQVTAFGSAPASTVALLYGTSAASLSNGTASAIAQGGTTTINGVSYYAFTVPSAQVANMQFFSFTGTQTAPGGVSGATSWFKADAGVTLNGSNVSALANQSDNTNLTQLTQPTAIRQPAFTANSWNFNPGITYDGSSDILENTFPSMLNVLNATNNEVFGAVSVTGGASAKVYFQVSDNGLNANRLSLESNIAHFPVNTSVIANTGLSQTSNLPSIINFATGSGNMSYAINGNTPVSTAFSGSITAGATPRYMLGAYNGAGSYSHFIAGNINEVTTYDRTLTTAERQRVQSYLGLKYGQTIGHNYLASDGTTTYDVVSHSNNIAGIGRDDLTALYQKQSQSQNTGFQVVVALGTVAASNQANANTIPTDKQLFVWGDNNGSLTTFVSTGNVTYPSRFTRNWKIRNTGSFAQDITVYFPVSAFGTSLASSVALLYGPTVASLNDGSALAIPQSGTTTINGVSYYAFNVSAAQIGGFQQFFSFTGNSVCYKPAATVGTTLDAKHGITALSRAGTSGDNWPMVRKGAWTVLEAKTKGFVINRLTAAQIAAIPPANLVEGMMVYDTTSNCMKVYTSTDGGTTFSWQCITTQTCPD